MRRLSILHEGIEARAGAITAARPDWPCRRGCDHCCRSLAEPMRVSRDEWELLAGAVSALDAEARELVEVRLREEGDHHPRTCAFLDRASGACLVYAARPIACRAYGFYAGRDGGRWCAIVEETPGLTGSVLLGNHDALERELETLAPVRPISAWFRDD